MNNKSIDLKFYLSEIKQKFAVTPLAEIDETFEEVDETQYGEMQAALARGSEIFKDAGGIWKIKG